MEHAYFRDRVSAYLDHSLPLQEQVIVEEHIKGCTECQKLLANIEKLGQLVQKQGELGGADDYWEKAAKKIEKRLGLEEESKITDVSRSRRHSGLTWKIAAVAASVVLLVYIGYHKSDILRENEMMTPSAPKVIVPFDTTNVTSPTPTATAEGEAKNALSSKGAAEAPRKDNVSRRAAQLKPSTTKIAPVQQELQTEKQQSRSAQPEITQSAPAPVPQPAQKTGMSDYAAAIKDTVTESEAPAVLDKLKQRAIAVISDSAPRVTARRDVIEKAGIVSDSVDVTIELAHWRLVRDSVQVAMKSQESGITKKLNLPSATAQGLTAGKPVPSARDQQELKLLEACYNIARLTTDTSEFNSAREVIQDVAYKPESANQQAATKLLDMLKKR